MMEPLKQRSGHAQRVVSLAAATRNQIRSVELVNLTGPGEPDSSESARNTLEVAVQKGVPGGVG